MIGSQAIARRAGVGVAVAASYQASVLADSPLGYWRLDELSGTSAADTSGNAHPGTYTGTYTQGATALLTSDTGKSLSLAGAGWVAIPDTASLRPGAGPWSVEFWIATSSATGFIVVSKYGTNGYHMNIAAAAGSLAAGSNFGSVIYDGTNQKSGHVNLSVTDGSPHHLVMTWAGGAALPALYIDGAAQTYTSEVSSGSPNLVNTDAMQIGAFAGNTTFRYTGRVGHVAVYGTALSAGRVSAHYAAR